MYSNLANRRGVDKQGNQEFFQNSINGGGLNKRGSDIDPQSEKNYLICSKTIIDNACR